MADSAAVVESSRDRASIETAVSDWITNNTPTSVDDVSAIKIGSNRVAVVIVYTA